MKTIETEILVSEDGKAVVPIPSGITPGRHAVVVVVDDSNGTPQSDLSLNDFPVDSVGAWPPDLSLRLEDMYDDDGR